MIKENLSSKKIRIWNPAVDSSEDINRTSGNIIPDKAQALIIRPIQVRNFINFVIYFHRYVVFMIIIFLQFRKVF